MFEWLSTLHWAVRMWWPPGPPKLSMTYRKVQETNYFSKLLYCSTGDCFSQNVQSKCNKVVESLELFIINLIFGLTLHIAHVVYLVLWIGAVFRNNIRCQHFHTCVVVCESFNLNNLFRAYLVPYLFNTKPFFPFFHVFIRPFYCSTYSIVAFSLLQKRRERCSIETPASMYAWNQLDSEGILPHILDRLRENVPPFYPLHSVIQLERGSEQGKDSQMDNLQKHVHYLHDVVRK